MNKQFSDEAWEEYLLWVDTDLKIVKRINELIRDIERHPFTGLGKPEPLKHELSGYWSRRITEEHRLIYRVKDGIIFIANCCKHYQQRR